MTWPMATVALLWWPPGHSLVPLAPVMITKARGGPMIWPMATMALPWWPHAHSRHPVGEMSRGGEFLEKKIAITALKQSLKPTC